MAVSSAMLLVPRPRYPPCSWRRSPATTTMPMPMGPGFPEQAPSVHTCTVSSDDTDDDGDEAGAAGFSARGLRGAGRAAGLAASLDWPVLGSRFCGNGR